MKAQKKEKRNKSDKKENKIAIWVILAGLLVMGAGFLMFGLIKGFGGEKEPVEDVAEQPVTRIVSYQNGQIEIPGSWREVEAGESGMVQYGNVEENSFISLFSYDTSEVTAEDFAAVLLAEFENDEKITEVEQLDDKLPLATAGKVVRGYDTQNKRWIEAWVSEMFDGKTYYIAVEGQDLESEAFQLPKKFYVMVNAE